MYSFKYLTAALLALILTACYPDEPPAEPPALARQLTDSLTLIQAAYDNLNLAEALSRARRLGAFMDSRQEGEVPDELRAEAYQYLAALHFERKVYVDSVAFYTNAAEPLLEGTRSVIRRAHQLLCRSYVSYARGEWLEMDMEALLGTKLMDQANIDRPSLYGQLLIARGFARKKYADLHLKEEEQRRAWEVTEGLFRQALLLYRDNGSPRERQAWDELIILVTRFPDRDHLIRPSIDSMRGVGDSLNPVYGFPDRLYGYWHHHRARPDSAHHYYRQFTRQYPLFHQYYVQEANYIIEQAAIAVSDYDEAFDLLVNEMEDIGCCMGDSREKDSGEVAFCPQPFTCIYLMAAQAKTHMLRYEQAGDPEDLKMAYRLSQMALAGYEASFAAYKEEGVLNKILEIGRRLLDISLQSAVAVAELDPTPEHQQSVFAAIEFGKTFLLSRDIVAAQEDTQIEQLRKLQSEITLMKKDYQQANDLPIAQLEQFHSLTVRHDRLERRLRNSRPQLQQSVEFGGSVPSLTSVRRQLGPQQALIEYANTATSTIALYTDQDTVLIFRVDQAYLPYSDTLTQWITNRESVGAAAYDSLANRLYSLLLRPVRPQLERRKSLLIVPSSTLNDLPFSALTVSTTEAPAEFSDLHFVLDDHAVRYLPSWRVEEKLRAIRPSKDRATSSIGVWTNPDLNIYLAQLGQELVTRTPAVNEHFTDRRSSVNTLIQNSENFDILHLSVHARGNPQQLYDNYLYISPTDSLNGVAITTMSLPAQLVVLAACSTGRGYASQGEGTFSLRRSFHLAGVPDVVCSLYDIPATATASLLEAFYDLYFSGHALDESLALAQRSCLRGNMGMRMRHPYYWAGLIVG